MSWALSRVPLLQLIYKDTEVCVRENDVLRVSLALDVHCQQRSDRLKFYVI